MLYRTILCATDGLAHSDRALQRAAEIARDSRAELHVVHVCEPGARVSPLARIRRQLSELAGDGRLTVVPHFPRGRGSVPRRLAQLAERVDADLVVVGSRGHGPLGSSVSERLQHETHRPLLVFGGDGPAAAERPARCDVREALPA